MSRTRVLVLAGGQSDEHEVSIISANSLLAAIDGSSLEATPVVITRAGKWLSPSESLLALQAGGAGHLQGRGILEQAKLVADYDVVFPLLHGPRGEDGTVQGMLELAGIPYVGSGVLASASCMDKIATKTILRAHGIPHLEAQLITRHEWQTGREETVQRCRKLRPPWFVKPANLGSSVGISKAHDERELVVAIDLAARYDRRIMVEQALSSPRELEVAVLGNDLPEASPVGEISYDSDWYDYETKYTDGRARLHIPAPLDGALAHRTRELAIAAFRALDCAGFARADFFHDAISGTLYLNELNTIPGFTPYSMFTKLWDHAGLSYPELVQRLVTLALDRHAERSVPAVDRRQG